MTCSLWLSWWVWWPRGTRFTRVGWCFTVDEEEVTTGWVEGLVEWGEDMFGDVKF